MDTIVNTPRLPSPAIARTRLIAAGLAAGIALGAGATAASAEMLCGERDQIIDELKGTWKEDRTASGLSNNGGVLEVYASEAGTWTLLLTMPDGPTCMIGAGEYFQLEEVEFLVGEPV